MVCVMKYMVLIALVQVVACRAASVQQCGISVDRTPSVDAEPDEVIPHSHPWMTSISVNGMWNCGGVIIHDQWIITSMHCMFQSADLYRVELGDHNKKINEGTEVTYKIDKYFNHPGSYGSYYGISLLKLTEPIKFGEFIQPICLPSNKIDTRKSYMSIGWGDSNQSEFFNGTVLRQSELRIFPTNECNSTLFLNGAVPSNCICAFDRNVKRCKLGSGDPLLTVTDNVWHLSGVTVWANGCPSGNDPGGYYEVFKFIEWIKATMRGN